jgi:hypothetical protein
LLNLGSTIPAPALIECIQAYLVVYFGNSYGVSYRGAELARQGINGIARDRWIYYLNNVLRSDEVILNKLVNIDRAPECLSAILDGKIALADCDKLTGATSRLARAALEKNHLKTRELAELMLAKLKA